LLDPGDTTPGSEIKISGISKKPATVLEFEDFKKVKMVIDVNQKATYNGKILLSEKSEVKSDKIVEKGAKIS